MVNLDFRNPRNYLITGLVVFVSLFALWLRLIPMFNMGNTDILDMVAMDDPLYNLRQVELIIANFPGYGWFEAMTHYPTGTNIYWGPLFPIIIAVCCLITGAATRPEIIGMGLLVPPFMAAAIVVLMYLSAGLLVTGRPGCWHQDLRQSYPASFLRSRGTATSITISQKCSSQPCSACCTATRLCLRKTRRSISGILQAAGRSFFSLSLPVPVISSASLSCPR